MITGVLVTVLVTVAVVVAVAVAVTAVMKVVLVLARNRFISSILLFLDKISFLLTHLQKQQQHISINICFTFFCRKPYSNHTVDRHYEIVHEDPTVISY